MDEVKRALPFAVPASLVLFVAAAYDNLSQVEGNWEMARRILKSLHLQNMDVDVVAYGAAIGACGRKGR